MYKPEILYHAKVDVFLCHTEMASAIFVLFVRTGQLVNFAVFL